MTYPARHLVAALHGYHPQDNRPRDNKRDLWTDDQRNERVAVSLFSELSSGHLILSAACEPEYTTLFRAGAPAWNSDFQWRTVDPDIDGSEVTTLQQLLGASFGSSQSGSAVPRSAGLPFPSYRWTWLALSGVRLKVDSRGPWGACFLDDARASLAIEAWEAAYFLDFEDQPRSRLKQVLDRLVQWRFSIARASAC